MVSVKFQRNLPFKIFRTLFLCFCKQGFNFHSWHILFSYHFSLPATINLGISYSSFLYTLHPMWYILTIQLNVLRSHLAYLEIGRRTRHLSTFPIPSSLWLFFLVFFRSFAILLSRNVSKLMRFSYACSLSFMCFHELLVLSFFPSCEKAPRKQ